MASRGASSTFVSVPPADSDRPAWGKIGVIAVIGFVVGVAWPRLAGVRLGPSLPESSAPAASTVPGGTDGDARGASVSYSAATAAATASGTQVTASAPPAEAGSHTTVATGDATPPGYRSAQVEWAVAIVRDTPREGKVVARLQRGTTVRIGPVKGGWYPVRFGDGFANEGWVYRGAMGR